jgi:hypothetical protein
MGFSVFVMVAVVKLGRQKLCALTGTSSINHCADLAALKRAPGGLKLLATVCPVSTNTGSDDTVARKSA